MTKDKRVYIVTTGEYDSYRIVAVCSTRYKVKKFVKWHKEKVLHIENWRIDDTLGPWC